MSNKRFALIDGSIARRTSAIPSSMIAPSALTSDLRQASRQSEAIHLTRLSPSLAIAPGFSVLSLIVKQRRSSDDGCDHDHHSRGCE
jgi:hypothetical protein